MANGKEKFVTTRSGDFESAGTQFKMTADPNSLEIVVDKINVGRLMSHGGRFVVSFNNIGLSLPVSMFADILRKRNEILEQAEASRKPKQS